MLIRLFLNSSHFTIGVLGALVFLILGILEIASWSLAKEIKTQLIRGTALFVLAAYFIVHATGTDLEVLSFSLVSAKTLALIVVLGTLYAEPILHPPPKKKKKSKAMLMLPFGLLAISITPITAVIYFLIALAYLRRSTEGYDKQLRPAFTGFFFLALSEFLDIAFFAADTKVVFWSNFLNDFGTLWIASHALEFIGLLFLGKWAWRYLRFKADTQLFVITFASSLVIFIATTFTFTFYLLRSLETDVLNNLKTDVSVLNFALDSLQSEALANAQVVAENGTFKEAYFAEDDEGLFETSLQFMLSQETDFLEVASTSGKVLMRAQDKDKIGDSIAGGDAVRSALSGVPTTTVTSFEGIISPEIQVRAAAPILKDVGGESVVSGVVVTGFSVDSVFVDGVKDVTGLDVTVFGDDTRAATTFVAPDGKSRFLGTKESNQKILDTVLTDEEVFIGPAQVLNQPYYTAYSPLKTKDEEVIGMLFVGKTQASLFDAADSAVRLTFIGTIVLMILSIPPNILISRYIKENLEA